MAHSQARRISVGYIAPDGDRVGAWGDCALLRERVPKKGPHVVIEAAGTPQLRGGVRAVEGGCQLFGGCPAARDRDRPCAFVARSDGHFLVPPHACHLRGRFDSRRGHVPRLPSRKAPLERSQTASRCGRRRPQDRSYSRGKKNGATISPPLFCPQRVSRLLASSPARLLCLLAAFWPLLGLLAVSGHLAGLRRSDHFLRLRPPSWWSWPSWPSSFLSRLSLRLGGGLPSGRWRSGGAGCNGRCERCRGRGAAGARLRRTEGLFSSI